MRDRRNYQKTHRQIYGAQYIRGPYAVNSVYDVSFERSYGILR